MSDLSRLLGDVYGGTTLDDPGAPPADHGSPGPEEPSPHPDWADEETLDAAFAAWVPGPPPEAPAAEREAVAGVDVSSAPEPDAIQPPAAHQGAGELVDDEPERPTEPDGEESWLFGLAEAVSEVPEPADAADGRLSDLSPPEPEVAGVRPMGLPWSRTEDDILPGRGGGRRLRFR